MKNPARLIARLIPSQKQTRNCDWSKKTSQVDKPVYTSFKADDVFPIYRERNWGLEKLSNRPKAVRLVSGMNRRQPDPWGSAFMSMMLPVLPPAGRQESFARACAPESSVWETKLLTSNPCLFLNSGWNVLEMGLFSIKLNHEKSHWVTDYLVKNVDIGLLIVASWKYHFPYY